MYILDGMPGDHQLDIEKEGIDTLLFNIIFKAALLASLEPVESSYHS